MGHIETVKRRKSGRGEAATGFAMGQPSLREDLSRSGYIICRYGARMVTDPEGKATG